MVDEYDQQVPTHMDGELSTLAFLLKSASCNQAGAQPCIRKLES